MSDQSLVIKDPGHTYGSLSIPAGMIEAVDVQPVRGEIGMSTLLLDQHIPESLRVRRLPGKAAADTHDGDRDRLIDVVRAVDDCWRHPGGFLIHHLGVD